MQADNDDDDGDNAEEVRKINGIKCKTERCVCVMIPANKMCKAKKEHDKSNKKIQCSVVFSSSSSWLGLFEYDRCKEYNAEHQNV